MKYISLIITLLSLFVANNLYAQNIIDSDEINYEKVKESDRAKLQIYFSNVKKLQGTNRLKDISKNLNLIANIYWRSNNYEQAIKYFNKSVEINEQLKNKHAIASISNFKGMIYADAKEYEKSIENFEKALAYYKLRRFRKDMIGTYLNMSLSYKNMKKMKKTIECSEAAFKIAQELNDVEKIVDCAGMLASYYQEVKNRKKANFYFNIYKAFNEKKDEKLKSSLQVLKLRNELSESEKKSKELELQSKEQKLLLKDKIIIEKDSIYDKLSEKYSEGQIISKLYEETIRQNEIIIEKEGNFLRLAVVGLIVTTLLLILAIYFYRKSRLLNKKLAKSNDELQEINNMLTMQKAEIIMHKEEIEVQRDELEKQRDYVITQRDKISQQNIQIKDSIHYARRIQKAVLPPKGELEQMVTDSFVLLMPRDIVSGDFYWLSKSKDKKIIAVADCTGHGVPGAFMSLLGSLLLNEIINKENITEPAEILNQLRTQIKQSLKQTGKIDEAKDGMDIVLIAIDDKNSTLEFAGAYNPLIIYRNKNIEVIKGDRMPIGIHAVEENFTNHKIKLQKNDKLYLFSDGYYDQLGGKCSRKFMFKKFKNMILENAEKDMSEQRELYLDTIVQWMAHKTTEFEDGHYQIDDILLMGIEI